MSVCMMKLRSNWKLIEITSMFEKLLIKLQLHVIGKLLNYIQLF